MDATEYGKTESDTWIKAEDLKGATMTLTIEKIEIVTYDNDKSKEPQHKLGLFFKGKAKGIVSNKTNTKRLIESFGAETDKWVGKDILVMPNETELGLGFRLQAAVGDFDDDISF